MVSLFSGAAARHVKAALDAAKVAGRVVVLDHPRLARQLAAERKDVTGAAHGDALERGGYVAVVAGGLALSRNDEAGIRVSGCAAAVAPASTASTTG